MKFLKKLFDVLIIITINGKVYRNSVTFLAKLISNNHQLFIFYIQCDAIRWAQFLRRCRHHQLQQSIRDEDKMLEPIHKSKYVVVIIIMISILCNIMQTFLQSLYIKIQNLYV